MDQLCKQVYEDEKLLYKYKWIVTVSPLDMVDAIITASKCQSTAMNKTLDIYFFLKFKSLVMF